MMSKTVTGLFMKTTDPAFVEAAGYAGMDYAILDMEHGPASINQVQNNIRAAQISGMLPIVRVEKLCEHAILQALDIGAAGVQVPKVSSAEQAQMVVKYAKYFPEGERGVCRFVRSARYSHTPKENYFKDANHENIVIIQLEGGGVLSELDAILNVKGIDIIFVGPYDLSQSLGLTGQTSHPEVMAAMKEIITRTNAVGIATGTFIDSPESYIGWKNAGVKYLSYSVDVGLFYEACKAIGAFAVR